jgi:hypothetical protein
VFRQYVVVVRAVVLVGAVSRERQVVAAAQLQDVFAAPALGRVVAPSTSNTSGMLLPIL